MNVLIACEETAAVRDAFIARGHNAWSCDLKPTRGRAANHLVGDVRHALDGWLSRHFPDAVSVRGTVPVFIKWDMMIAFPECTYLASSGLWRNRHVPGRGEKTKQALAFVRLLLDADIWRIALENPVGCIGTRIKPASQYIHPYQFGHDASKKTGLWLKNLPKLKPTRFVEPRVTADGKERWSNQTDSGQNKLGPSEDRAFLRGATYPGIAQAMAEQWG